MRKILVLIGGLMVLACSEKNEQVPCITTFDCPEGLFCIDGYCGTEQGDIPDTELLPDIDNFVDLSTDQDEEADIGSVEDELPHEDDSLAGDTDDPTDDGLIPADEDLLLPDGDEAMVNEGPVFYISSSSGNDGADGKSPATAWKTFALVNLMPLEPGDTIYLKAGDTWDEGLDLWGSGMAGSPIRLTRYGEGENPRIARSDPDEDIGAILNNPSFWEVSFVDFSGGKIGLYLRYENSSEHTNVTVGNCAFEQITDPSYWNDLGTELAENDYEYAWSAGIMVGGKIHAAYENANILDQLILHDLSFTNTDVGFITNFYFPPVYKGRITGLAMRDISAYQCAGGAFALNFVDGGIVERVRALYSGGALPNGTTGAFAQSCRNVEIDDCEFAYTIRDNCPDGIGFDFEGDNEDFIFSNNVIHHNDGASLLVMSTINHNSGITIQDNTFYANAENPLNEEQNREMMCHDSGNTGTIQNNGFYRLHATATYTTKWDGFTQSGNRETTFTPRSDAWEFDTASDLEGWGAPNHIASLAVSGGMLSGISTGDDPFVHSPPIFVNKFEKPFLKIRLRTTAGSHAQIFYLTETDAVWDGPKSIPLPLVDNSDFHEYTIDMRSFGIKGVLTAIRIDPAIVTGAEFQIDWIRFGVTE